MPIQWEHMTLQAHLNDEGNYWEVSRVNDQKVPDQGGKPPLVQYLNDLGRDGWEVVTAQLEESLDTVLWKVLFIRIPNGWTKTRYLGVDYQGPDGFHSLFLNLGQEGWEFGGVLTEWDPFFHPIGNVAILRKQLKKRAWRYVLKRLMAPASA